MPEDRDYPAMPPRTQQREPERSPQERNTDQLPALPSSVVEHIIERVVEKPVDRIVEVEKIVEKPVERIIERIIEKPIEVEKIVTEVVYVDRPPLVQEPSPSPVHAEKTYVYIQPDQRTDREMQPDKISTPMEVGPEAKRSVQQKSKPEAKIVPPEAQTEVVKPAQPELKKEEKSSKSEEKSSGATTKKLKLYNGLGRRHTAAEIDEILDGYLLYGELPDYVSKRQQSSYKHHIKLPERRQLLEQAGLIKTASRTKKRGANMVSGRRPRV